MGGKVNSGPRKVEWLIDDTEQLLKNDGKAQTVRKTLVAGYGEWEVAFRNYQEAKKNSDPGNKKRHDKERKELGKKLDMLFSETLDIFYPAGSRERKRLLAKYRKRQSSAKKVKSNGKEHVVTISDDSYNFLLEERKRLNRRHRFKSLGAVVDHIILVSRIEPD